MRMGIDGKDVILSIALRPSRLARNVNIRTCNNSNHAEFFYSSQSCRALYDAVDTIKIQLQFDSRSIAYQRSLRSQ